MKARSQQGGCSLWLQHEFSLCLCSQALAWRRSRLERRSSGAALSALFKLKWKWKSAARTWSVTMTVSLARTQWMLSLPISCRTSTLGTWIFPGLRWCACARRWWIAKCLRLSQRGSLGRTNALCLKTAAAASTDSQMPRTSQSLRKITCSVPHRG